MRQYGSRWLKCYCMAISMIEHRGSCYYIFDERGKREPSVSDSIGELLGWSDQFFITHKFSFYNTYDQRGKKIHSISDSIGSFVSITADQFVVRKFNFLYTYDMWGRRKDSRPVR